jgi:hypothetical protein
MAAALAALSLAPARAPAQSAAAPASATPKESRSAGPSTPAPATSPAKNQADANLQKLLKTHKVITTDDLEAADTGPAVHFDAKEYTRQPSRDGTVCDADCAAEARADVGMGPSQEGEWQAQLSAARLSLAADREWREAYFDGFRKVHNYCVFQDQQQKAPPPTGNDYQSLSQRAQWERYVIETNRSLGQSVEGVAERLGRLADEAEKTDPVRAAIMRVLAARVLDQCPCPCDP